jgi:predicted RNA-binding Zn ribbon-like protein
VSAAIEPPRFREGAGRLCLDFIRTLRNRGTAGAVEELVDGPALAAWTTQMGPVAVGPEQTPTPAQVQQARALREAVYALVAAARTTGPGSCPPEARELVNHAASTAVPRPWLDASGELRWRADEPVAGVLALAARDALELVTSPALHRVRDCASPDCGAVFLDSSRPGTRRWCSMGTCGNQAKKATYRTKAASAGVS